MRLALAQLDFTIGAFDDNFAKIRGAVTRAADAQANIVIFSEMATTGYPPRDLLTRSAFIDRNLDQLERVAALSTSQLAILIGYVDRNTASTGKRLFNAAALCAHGRVVERRQKLLLPTYDVFDEDRYFEPGDAVTPIEWKGVRLGVTICEDVWNDGDFWPKRLYHRDPVSELVAQNADLLINLSSSPFDLRKAAVRRDMIRQNAVKHQRYFFYVNQVGGNDELIFDGHSIGIAPDGSQVVRARDFAEDFIVFDVPVGGDRTSEPVLRQVSGSDEEAAYGALVLGLRDYTRKCGFTGAVLGLSGGIDSALTACLAADALGADNVTGVMMPTRYSSAHSVGDADDLARNLGIRHVVISIDGIFQSHLDALAKATGACSEAARDMTEQNLQARARGAVLMALSNSSGSILLTTGNKSELAVGYCTLYGDMAGGLAVISDVPKTMVYRLARFVNRARVIIPESSITKPPSAELKPDQKDQDTLPPYDILDQIIEAFVEREMDVDRIVGLGLDRATVVAMVHRINTSEYKRRQAAPGLKISSKAFGVGRRFPVAADYRVS